MIDAKYIFRLTTMNFYQLYI